MDKVYVITDFGPGDGGKGGIVHALSCAQDDEVNLIIKRGGAQGSHGVRTSYKESFNFSQWGCGTLEGIPTFCSEQMIISPVGLRNESEALKRLGITDPFMLLNIDPNCICATPFHKISSQLEELLLGKNPRGTIGTGVGRAYRMLNEQGDRLHFAHLNCEIQILLDGNCCNSVSTIKPNIKICPKTYFYLRTLNWPEKTLIYLRITTICNTV